MLRSLTVILRFSLCDWSAADAVMATSSQEIDPAPPADRPAATRGRLPSAEQCIIARWAARQ
jgi:hypothetical protein